MEYIYLKSFVLIMCIIAAVVFLLFSISDLIDEKQERGVYLFAVLISIAGAVSSIIELIKILKLR